MILYESFNEIHSICREYEIDDYTINSDGSIDVDGDVDLDHTSLYKLPLKFNKVKGNFECNNNRRQDYNVIYNRTRILSYVIRLLYILYIAKKWRPWI